MGALSFTLPTIGASNNQWGGYLNGNFQSLQAALSAYTALATAGGTTTATAAQAGTLVLSITGALTSGATCLLPAAGAFYVIANNTTGAFPLTVGVVGGANTVTVPQGSTLSIYTTPTGAFAMTTGFTGLMAGWGTSTGGTRGGINGGTATLGQTAAALAQLLIDLKAIGILAT